MVSLDILAAATIQDSSQPRPCLRSLFTSFILFWTNVCDPNSFRFFFLLPSFLSESLTATFIPFPLVNWYVISTCRYTESNQSWQFSGTTFLSSCLLHVLPLVLVNICVFFAFKSKFCLHFGKYIPMTSVGQNTTQQHCECLCKHCTDSNAQVVQCKRKTDQRLARLQVVCQHPSLLPFIR